MCICAKLRQSCPTLCDPMDCSPPRLPYPWESPGKNTEVGCYPSFPPQESKLLLIMSPAVAGKFFLPLAPLGCVR